MPEPTQPETSRAGAGDSGQIDPGSAERCPQCGAASINVHGLTDCPDCSWTGPTRRR